MEICISTGFVPLQLTTGQLAFLAVQWCLWFLFVLFSHLFSVWSSVFSVHSPAHLTQYFHVVKTSDKEVVVFAQYLLFSFEKEAAVDKWVKVDSLSFFFL